MRGILKLVDHMNAHPGEVLAMLPDERRERLGVPVAQPATDATLDLPWSGDDLLFVAENTGVLIGNREVCAGTPSMIRRTLDTMLTGREGDQDTEWVEALIGDSERFMAFSQVLYETSPRMRAYMIKSRDRLQVIQRQTQALGTQAKRSRIYRSHSDGLERFLIFERRVLEFLHAQQSQLLALFGVDGAGLGLLPQQMNELASKNPRDLIEVTYGAHTTYEAGAIRVAFLRDFKHRDLVIPFSSA